MSKRYPGGIITKSPATPTGPIETGAAPGIWTLEQQMQYKQQGIWPIAGNVANYIEDVFSTYLYTGNGTTQTITNGIDLSTKGGLVWQKDRVSAGQSHILCDTARGVNSFLRSDLTSAAGNNGGTDAVYAFNSNGFSTGTVNGTSINLSGDATVSWTFRKQPKFFDVVTYTGDGTTNRSIAHNLGSTPGCLIVKKTTSTGAWHVYHRSLSTPLNKIMVLNTTGAEVDVGSPFWGVSSTDFSLPASGGGGLNNNGDTYVAYLFAHDAGGFGLTGTDNVISCGSFTTNGSGIIPTVNLGYEPQWIIFKSTTSVDSWYMADNMRGWYNQTADQFNGLRANLSNAEVAGFNGPIITPTGFTGPNVNFGASNTFIYIAIRRGPMKVPTSGTSVFGDISASVEPVSTNLTTESGVLTDLVVHGLRISDGGFGPHWLSRLTGNGAYLVSSGTAAEVTQGNFWKFDNNNFAYIPPSGYANNSSSDTKYVAYSFKRAPSFFDVVCYTGTGTAMTVNHNLGIVPELTIIKNRTSSGSWFTMLTVGGFSWTSGNYMILNGTNAKITYTALFDTNPTAAVFSLKSNNNLTNLGDSFVAYLFATCAGVSKVGSYTGNGTTQTIDCGFTGGARFVLLKRTDATGDWYVYDTARGMTVLTDPYLLLNTTAAEVATLGSVTTVSTGFALNSAILAAINISAGSYIFLAIA